MPPDLTDSSLEKYKSFQSASLSQIYHRMQNKDSVLEDSFLRGSQASEASGTFEVTEENGAFSLESEAFLQVRKENARSRSLPVNHNKLINKSGIEDGEWAQKLTSPLSLLAIYERCRNNQSLLEDSFIE